MHLLLISSFNPTLTHFAKFKVCVEGFIFLCQLNCLTIGNIHQVNFVGTTHRVALHKELLAIGMNTEQYIVGNIIRNLLYITVKVGLVEVCTTMPHTTKIKRVVIRRPSKFVDATLETFSHISFFTRSKLINAEACAVAFITIALHAAPSDILSIG